MATLRYAIRTRPKGKEPMTWLEAQYLYNKCGAWYDHEEGHMVLMELEI